MGQNGVGPSVSPALDPGILKRLSGTTSMRLMPRLRQGGRRVGRKA